MLLLGLWAWTACRKKAPEPLWPDDKMARIMADLSIADGAANGLKGYAHDSLTKIYYGQVFELHGVSMADYEQNLRLLSHDVPRLQAVMDSSMSILKKKLPPGGASKLNVPKE